MCAINQLLQLYLRAYTLKETSTPLNRVLLSSAAVGPHLPGIS
jgi:hypothetical protein